MPVDVEKILENGTGETTCSICGSPVFRYIADGGTQSYIPLFTRKEVTEMAEEIISLRAELRAAREALRETANTIANIVHYDPHKEVAKEELRPGIEYLNRKIARIDASGLLGNKDKEEVRDK